MNYDSPFMGKSIAVTGKLNSYTRSEIKARLLELGARPVSKISKRTDYLILGERPGSKLVKALALKITILSEREFEEMSR
jgi:DNA ligase (NAD+)